VFVCEQLIPYAKIFKQRERERVCVPAGQKVDFSQRDLHTEASYPRANNPSVTIFLQQSSLRLHAALFFSMIFVVSASKFLSYTLAHATIPYQITQKNIRKMYCIAQWQNKLQTN